MKNEKAYRPFQLLALTIPAAEAAAGKNWLPTLILALASTLICTGMSALTEPKLPWLSDLRSIGAILLLSSLLGKTHACWPGRGAAYVVPGVLLLLAMYAVWRDSAVRAASVLRYGVYLVLLVMAGLGLMKVRLTQLRPGAELPDAALSAALLLPLLGRKDGNWRVLPNGIAALLSSLLTVGSASLYAFSRGLSLAGVTEHMESLAACAITIGWFASICYVLDGVAGRDEKKANNKTVWLLGGISFGLYALGVRFDPGAIVAVELTLWAAVPALWALKEKMRKSRKHS